MAGSTKLNFSATRVTWIQCCEQFLNGTPTLSTLRTLKVLSKRFAFHRSATFLKVHISTFDIQRFLVLHIQAHSTIQNQLSRSRARQMTRGTITEIQATEISALRRLDADLKRRIEQWASDCVHGLQSSDWCERVYAACQLFDKAIHMVFARRLSVIECKAYISTLSAPRRGRDTPAATLIHFVHDLIVLLDRKNVCACVWDYLLCICASVFQSGIELPFFTQTETLMSTN